MRSQLLTISDLYDPDNDWKPLLQHVAYLKVLYESYKASQSGSRSITLDIGGSKSRAPGLHASELHACLRQSAYSLMGVEKVDDVNNRDVNMLMRFDLGHAVHRVFQDEFQEMCLGTYGTLTFEDEVKIGKGTHELCDLYQISSSSDGLFTFYRNTGEPYLRVGLEIKTASEKEYEKINNPKDAHLSQGSLYQKMLDVPLMWYLYYNKSNSFYTPPTAPWVVPFDKAEWNKVESRAKQVHLLVSQNTLPDREEGMPCTWCSYALTCEPTYRVRTSTAKKKKTPIRPRRFT